MALRFDLVDVFGVDAFSGNPLAVVHDADALDGETMQRITRWFNLSETTFLLEPTTPGADYRVRIFTLERELPFAGHPTLGSCQAWLAAGGQPGSADWIVQECGVGNVPLRREGGILAFAAPPRIRSGDVEEAQVAETVKVLRIDREQVVEAQWVDNGPGWIALLLGSAEEVLAVDPMRHHPGRIEIGLVGPHPAGNPLAYEVRALFTDQNGTLIEDPVTGSLNASVAQWMVESGRATPPFTASQGTRLGRQGRIQIDRSEDGSLWIGGKAAILFSGEAAF